MSSLYPENDVLAPNNGIPRPSGAPAVARAPLGGPSGFMPKSGAATTPAPATAPGVPPPAPPGTPPPTGATPATGTTPAAGFQIPYAAYLNTAQGQMGSQSSEGGSSFTPVSEQQWNAMSNEERYNNLFGTSGAAPDVSPDATTAAAFRAQFGNETWQANASGFPEAQGQLIYGYGPPTRGVNRDGPDQFAIDPSRIMYLPDGRWVMEASNVRGQWLAQDQATDSRHSDQNFARAAAALAGGTIAAGAFGGANLGSAGYVDTIGDAATGANAGAPLTGAVTPAATADALTPTINQAIADGVPQVTIPGDIPLDTSTFAGTPLAPTPEILPPGTPGIPPPAGVPGGGPGVPTIDPGPNLPPATPPGPGTPLVNAPAITAAPGATNPWTVDNLLTPGNVARVGLTAAGALAQHGAKPSTPAPGSPGANPAANPALNDQATQDILSRGKPTVDQMQFINDSIEQQRKTATEQIIQASYNAGQGGASSMLAKDKLIKLDSDLSLLKETMIQKQASENVSNALKELGTLSTTQIALAELAYKEDQAAQAQTAAIMQSIMYLWANV
jgi:hypothetical protein